MSNYYVHLDVNSIVIGIYQLSGQVNVSEYVEITEDQYSLDLIGKQYDATNKVFNAVPLTLDQEKQLKLEQLQSAFAESFSTFPSGALGTTKNYPADAEAVQNMQYYVSLLAANPNKSTVYFKTIEDGKPVAHTRTQFFQVVDDFEAFDVNKVTQFDTYAAQINAATDIPTLQAMTFTFS